MNRADSSDLRPGEFDDVSLTPDQIHAARLHVCEAANDKPDALLLMDALGIGVRDE